jgi:hypothetical protein
MYIYPFRDCAIFSITAKACLQLDSLSLARPTTIQCTHHLLVEIDRLKEGTAHCALIILVNNS